MDCFFNKQKRYYNYGCFSENLDESGRKPNKIWVVEGSEFYNKSLKSWPQNNNMEMYSTHNEGKSVVVVERFFRILKDKLYKYLTSIPKNVCIDKLDDIVKKVQQYIS